MAVGAGLFPLLRNGLVLRGVGPFRGACPLRDAIAAHSASNGSVVPFVFW